MELCQPPRAITTAPHFSVPAGAWDCHAHIIGPEALYPYVGDRNFTPPDALESAYLKMLGSLGVERAVIVQLSIYGTNNTRVLDAIRAIGPQRACGIAMTDADVGIDELRRLDAGGIKGTRFITTTKGGPTLEILPDVARKVAEVGWHIEMYVPPAVWPDVLPVIDSLPVPVVFDHLGSMTADRDPNDPVLTGILRRMETGRFWVKLCGHRASLAGKPFTDVAFLAKLFLKHAPERCVWGSDWPHTNIPGYMPDDGELLDLLAEWAPDAETRRKVLVENPAKLYRAG